MSGPVRRHGGDGVAVLTIDRPPRNLLTAEVRAALSDAVAAAGRDPAASAILIEAAGPNFCTGVPLEDPGDAARAPRLAALCSEVEACGKPVIAALQGLALDGGLELALAAHYRIAAREARLGLPEVTLGLLPEGGTTQRLPRLAGAAEALDLLLTGLPLDAPQARQIGLVDRLADGPLPAAARALAAELVAEGARPRPAHAVRTRIADGAAHLAAVAAARETIRGAHLHAPSRAVDCVEAAALLPWAAGLEFEAAAAADCRAGEQAQALCHVARAERRAAARDVAAPPETLGILGAGAPALDTAAAALGAGIAVTLVAPDGASASAARDAVAARLGEARMPGAIRALSVAAEPAALEGLALVAEATGGSLETAAAELARLHPELEGARAVVSLSHPGRIAELAAQTGLGAKLAGLDAGLGSGETRVAEVIAAPGCAEAARRAALGLAQALSRLVVPASGVAVGRTVAGVGRAAVEVLAAQGVGRGRIEAALAEYGLPPGWSGLAARSGQPNGGMTAEGIRARVLWAMANAGARLLEGGHVARSGQIDLVMVHNHGFPRWRGGPMLAADLAGPLRVQRALLDFAEDAPALWTPSGLFAELIKTGRRFGDLGLEEEAAGAAVTS